MHTLPESRASITAVVVDDSELLTAVMAEDLEREGVVVLVAHSGLEALALVDGPVRPDVVVCDLHMPDLDGFEVLRRLRVIDPDLPLIMHSTDQDLGAVLGAVRRGAYDYVPKLDDDRGPLLAAIGRAADHGRILRENRRLADELRSANSELARNLAEVDDQNRRLDSEVAERKLAQEALAEAHVQALDASHSKSAFMANMSHELRTPLNAILGYSELLREGAEETGNDSDADDLRRIEAAANHLLALINDVLDIARIEAGRVTVHLERVALDDFLREVCDIARPLAERNGNVLTVVAPARLGEAVLDIRKARQCLLNLLANASKFTSEGRIDLTFARTDGELVFSVADTGIGMTADQCARVFDEFVQADATIRRRFGGTGLGLAISRRLCHLMRGSLTVQSVPGVGSSFEIRLPTEGVVATKSGRTPAQAPVRSSAPRVDPQGIERLRRQRADVGVSRRTAK